MTRIVAERMTAHIDGEIVVLASGRFESAGGRMREGRADLPRQ